MAKNSPMLLKRHKFTGLMKCKKEKPQRNPCQCISLLVFWKVKAKKIILKAARKK